MGDFTLVSPESTAGLVVVDAGASQDPPACIVMLQHSGSVDSFTTYLAVTVETDPGEVVVFTGDDQAIGSFMPAGTTLEWSVPDLSPGSQYVARGYRSLSADPVSTGWILGSQAFVVPVAESRHAVYLGPDPTNVAVVVDGLPDPLEPDDDAHAVAYARSSTADETGIDGSWSDTVPTDWPAGTDWYLLIRARVWRRSPGHVPAAADGIDKLTIRWKGAG